MWFAIQVVGWFAAMVVLMSIIEHQIHCKLMHKSPRFPWLRGLEARKKIFTSHAVKHHGQYREHFHGTPLPAGEDRGIRLDLFEGLLQAVPVCACLACVSFMAAAIFPLVVCLHHLIWNQIHLEMHQPQGRFFASWAAYRFVARHHFLHHRHPDKNFNVALPVGDWIFRTVAIVTDADRRAMEAEGIC